RHTRCYRDWSSTCALPISAGLTMSNQRRYIAVVKWRNHMLALVCLLAFAGLGILYFQHWVVQKPFGIILFIGEGLASHRLAATQIGRASCRERVWRAVGGG